jgi:membrane protein
MPVTGSGELLTPLKPENQQQVATDLGPIPASSLRWSQIKLLLADTRDNAFRHKLPRLGAALAFYTMLSLAPLLIVVVAVAGLVWGRQAAVGQLVWQIEDLVGHEAAQAITAVINAAHRPASGVIATVLGLITLFFGASSAMAELRDDLNVIWDVPPGPDRGKIRTMVGVLQNRTLAFAMVLAIGLFLLTSVAINTILSGLGRYFEWYLPTSEWILQGGMFFVSFLVFTLLFGTIYKVLPDVPNTWGDVWPGAIVTSLLFTIGKLLIGLYLGKAGTTSAYGAAGSLVIVLIWVYYSAQIFFLGAEFTHAYAEHYGSKPSERARQNIEVVSH